MALPEHKQKAIELRKQGMSYSLIRKELPVAKSTLSGWLKDYPFQRSAYASYGTTATGG